MRMLLRYHECTYKVGADVHKCAQSLHLGCQLQQTLGAKVVVPVMVVVEAAGVVRMWITKRSIITTAQCSQTLLKPHTQPVNAAVQVKETAEQKEQ
jgi:hypothetical protein